jgi:pimeloyl-ACP methyl ester carboxylesterase
MLSWQSGFVNTNGSRLHYTRTGGAQPPLVLAHGVTDDGLCWSPLAAVLAAEYDVIMLDARGHGLSDAPLEGYGPIDLADDLAGAIQELDLKTPIILGHSLGAISTLILAGRYPHVPCAIAMEDPPPWWDPASPRPFAADWQAGMRAWITALQQQPRQAIIDVQRVETPRWTEAELEPWADAKLHFNLNFFDQLRDPRIEWPALLRNVQCPALLIIGDPEAGAIVTQNAALLLEAHVPQLRVAHVAGAGHSIRRDQFASYLQVVRPFFAEMTGRD